MNEKKYVIKLAIPGEPDAQTLLALKNKLLNTRVKGVPDVERVTIVKQEEEWVIQTAGSNIAKVVAVNGVDKSRVTNHTVYEICQIHGTTTAHTSLVKRHTDDIV